MSIKKIENFTNKLIENGKCKIEDREIVVYGLSSAVELSFNIITTIIIGFIFNMVLESVIFLVSSAFLRTYAGGYHCEKTFNCYIMSSGSVAITLAIVKFTVMENMISISMIILLLSVSAILKFAPVAAPHKPLDSEETMYYRKKTVIHLVILCCLVVVFFSCKLYSFAFVIFIVIAITSILVLLQNIIKITES